MPARVLLPLLVALVAMKLALDHLADSDLFWHLRLGLDMLERHALPRTVEYNWPLAGAPYLPNDWLAELLFASAFRAGGFPTVALVKAAACVALVLALYRNGLARTTGHLRASALTAFVMTLVAASNFITRPVLLGMLCLSGLTLACWRAADGSRRAAFAIPALVCLWANVHGSWPVALGPVAALLARALVPFARGRLVVPPVAAGARRTIFLAALLVPLAAALTPLGPAGLVRPFKLVGRQGDIRVFDEWSPVPLNDPSAWFLLASWALLAFALAKSKRPLALPDLGLALLTAAMAWSTALYHVVFAVMAAPLLAEHLAPLLAREGFENRRLNAVVAAVAALLLGLISAGKLVGWRQDVAAAEPVEVVRALGEAGLRDARGFNYFDWGGLLVFERFQTYVDGRLEPFLEHGTFAAYLALERSGDVGALEQQGVTWMLVRKGLPMAEALARREGWSLLAEDEKAEAWVRR